MLYDTQRQPRYIPSLVHLCQQVATAHAEGLIGLGDLPYSLLEPILQACTPETLARVEDTSPQITSETPDLWRGFCFKTYPTASEEALEDETETEDFWRNHFFRCREAEARRFEAIGSKIRSQRMEAERQKKEKEIKMTDRIPPSKRQRVGWPPVPVPQKSLFQKTRVAASRVQRVFGPPALAPPMITGKGYPLLSSDGNTGAKMDFPSLTAAGGTATVSKLAGSATGASPLVTVRKVATYRSKSNSSLTSTSSTSASSVPCQKNTETATSLPKGGQAATSSADTANVKPDGRSSTPPSRSATASPQKQPRPKNDPMAKLFMPKHRAYSQLANKKQGLPSR